MKSRICSQLLLEVGENGDDKLRGLAYAQLVVGIADSPNFTGQGKYNIDDLCDKALQYGRSNPTVLTHIGRSLNKMGKDVDRAIDYLKQALDLRLNSITYHHLGLCYENKAGIRNNNQRAGLLDKSSNGDLPADSSYFSLKDAKKCYKQAIKISQEENTPSRLSLGNLYFYLGDFENALAQYNQIIDNIRPGNITSLILAHEKAEKCLKKISNDGTEAKEHITKAISLAADLVSLNAFYKHSTAEVWASFAEMWSDVENEPQSIKKDKSKIQLLHLIKMYKDIVPVIKTMFIHSPETCDVDIYQVGLQSCLQSQDYEVGLLLTNLAKINATITRDGSWSSPEMKKLQTSVYMAVIRERCLKDSQDLMRAFQLMFQFKYSQCYGMVGEGDDMEATDIRDVLILNDEGADNEEGLGVTSVLAFNLSRVFQTIYGLDTSINLKRCSGCGLQITLQLEEMKKCQVLVLILGDNDSEEYSFILNLAHQVQAKNLLVVTCREQKEIPAILQVNQILNMNDEHWRHFLQNVVPREQENVREDPSAKELVHHLFDGDQRALMDLFGFLVDER